MNSPGQNTGVGSLSLLQGLLDSLPAEPQGKPKNTGVGSLSLLQRIFPTQESNRGLLHCRPILYQLSNQGSPHVIRDGKMIMACVEYQLKVGYSLRENPTPVMHDVRSLGCGGRDTGTWACTEHIPACAEVNRTITLLH